MRKIVAQVIQDVGDWQRDRVRLAMREERMDGWSYLLSDGTWSEPGEPGDLPKLADGIEIGLALPEVALDAMLEAIEEKKGAAAHGPTEARVLREALDVERGRVDRILERRAE